MAHVNVFKEKTDEELTLLYGQFLEAEKVGVFSTDNELGKIKREYENDFGANTTLMLQIELTHIVADRWYKEHNKDKTKQLYVVEDIPRYAGDHSCYKYVVRANDYGEAEEIVKRKTKIKSWEFEADAADNNEIWE